MSEHDVLLATFYVLVLVSFEASGSPFRVTVGTRGLSSRRSFRDGRDISAALIPAGPSRLCLARCNPKVISSQRVVRRALASAWAAYAGLAPGGSGGRDENDVTIRLSSIFSSINIGVSAAAALSPVTSSSAPACNIRELRIPVLRAGAALMKPPPPHDMAGLKP